MTSTASTSTNVLPPYFIWRRPIRPKTSSQRRARCSAMRTAPPANQGQNPPRRTRPQRSQAVAATITRKPRGARKSTAFLKRLLMGVSGPPPLALHRLVGQEEAAGYEAQVEHHVLQVEHSLDHVLHVGRHPQVGHRLGHRPRRGIVRPAEGPDPEEEAEGQDA